MHVDLITLYLLAIGTLFASSGMTLWERRTHPIRSGQLAVLAAGYATLGIGCAAAVFRRSLPGATGSGLSNLVMMCGYLLILHGVARFNGRLYRAESISVLIVVALGWIVGGARWQDDLWNYVSAFPIALVSGATSFELLRSDGLRGLKSRLIAVVVSGVHAIFYAFRAFVLPWVGARYGRDVLMLIAQITMYEGVLYSVILPMTLLTLVREETHGQLLQESQTDYLTGLGNRRWFFEQGARVMSDAGAAQAFSLLAFDLDHFKRINDRYGHEAGDEVLKSFSRIVRHVVGGEAVLARIGGEEFAALLPSHDPARAQGVAETIVRSFAAAVAHSVEGVHIKGTVSIGLAHSASTATTLAELLAQADQALYRAKSLGGDRLEIAPTTAPPHGFAARSTSGL